MSYRLITDHATGNVLDDDGRTVEVVNLGVPPTNDGWRELADDALFGRGWKRTAQWNEGSTSLDRLTPVPEETLEIGKYVEFRTGSDTSAHGRITRDERAEFGTLTVRVNDVDEHLSVSPWCVLGEVTPPKISKKVICAAPGCGRAVPRRAQVPITSLGARVCNQDCWDRHEADM